MPGWLVAAAALSYICFLFWVAWRAESAPVTASSSGAAQSGQAAIYTLAIAVYCSSWTFYGAVGSAVSQGWSYLPIYLGPALVFLFGRDFLHRLGDATRRENLTSIGDFVSSRYGKSRAVGALVAVLATLGALPYIALQLKALGASAHAIVAHGPSQADPASPLPVAAMAALLAVFAIVFGARRYEATGRNRGLVAAMAVESVIKLGALLVLAFYCLWFLSRADGAVFVAGAERLTAMFAEEQIGPRFITITLLSMAAIVCLPRQFYIGFVECRDPTHLSFATRWFPVYMLATSLVVIPIAWAGLAFLPPSATPDMYVLELPLSGGADWLALLVFLGGFSAATGMVIVESVALATMISNDIVAPILLRSRRFAADRDVGGALLLARRLVIVGVIGLAFLYYLKVDQNAALASMGLIAFAAVAQIAPALIAAVYWPGATRRGAAWGLGVGLSVWAYTLLLPAYLGSESLLAMGLKDLFGGAVDPHALFGVSLFDPLTHGVIWSLGLNTIAFILGSKLGPVRVADRLQAAVFSRQAAVGGIGPAVTMGDLQALAARFVGPDRASRAFQSLAVAQGRMFHSGERLDAASAQEAERLVASVIGASSARVIVGSALRRGSVDVADVVSLLDVTSQELHFSRELLAATLDNIDQGVSVVDRDLRLVAWNQRYLEIFSFPAGFIHVGRPIADVIRYNALLGECGPGEVDAHVEKRLAHMRRGQAHTWERRRPNGMVLQSTGNPMPGGGYVTSFTDITTEKRAQEQLVQANEQLEARVHMRTAELAAAKEAADQATQSKTKFLAAASHDLLQPLNAARLFSSALADVVSERAEEAVPLVESIQRSISVADRMLRQLLEVSKLASGGVQANPTVFAVQPMLEELVHHLAPMAQAKGLRLKLAPTQAFVCSDRALLQSILQNFLSNAVRYTSQGGALVGARVRGDQIRLEVWDTGPGVPAEKRRAIFEEFRRLDGATDADGVGLGLAIVERTARILGAHVGLRSTVGKGSVFSIEAPRAQAPGKRDAPRETTAGELFDLRGVRVLVLDDEPEIVEAMDALLTGWGCVVETARTSRAALALARATRFDCAVVDVRLGGAMSGLQVAAALKRAIPGIGLVLATAERGEMVARMAQALGAEVLHKPVDSARLRRFLALRRATQPVA